MKFKYQAKTREGENQVGFVEAPSRDVAASILSSHNLFILTLNEVGKEGFFQRFESYFSKRLKKSELVIFTRQLAMLLEARVPLNTSLKAIHEQSQNPILKEAALEIAEDIDAGLPFSQAIERQPEIFSGFFSSMVRSAEITGNLENVMNFLADYLEREYSLQKRVESALIYPGMIIGLFIVVSFILVAFVIPQISPIFRDAGVNLPFFVMILVGVGAFVGQWWPVVALGLFFLALFAIDYFQTPEGKALKDELKIKLPMLKSIYLPLTITRIANSASMLLRGGVPIVQSLEIIGETADNVVYKEIMHQIAEEVRQGQQISASASKYPEYFPSTVTQMIAVGEAAGQLEQTFSRISVFYGREADSVINNIVELIQPVLIIGVGILVGLLFSSILLPIYQLIGTIR